MASSRTLILSATVAALFASAGTALAVVDFEQEYGTGFVGKGDVQNVFGWNNATLQRHATQVGFKYAEVNEYDAVCLWVTGPDHNRRTHRVTKTATSAVESMLDGLPRQGPSQFTGFNLLGWTNPEPTVTGQVPQVGGSCLGEGTNGTWETVTEISSSGTLYATHNGSDKAVWTAPWAP